MEYRPLGNTGCAVSRLALGTMTFGAESSEQIAHSQLDTFVAAGGTLIDTADVYSAGISEEIVGKWLARTEAAVTDRVVLATKGRFPMGDSPNDLGLSRRHLQRALEDSLRRLGVDCVDLYQVHSWDPLTPIAETLRTLDGFVKAGKIRYVGLSNFTGWQVQKAVATAAALGLEPPVTLQPQYSLLVRELEWGGRALVRRRGSGPAALVSVGRRLVDREISPGRQADRSDPIGREPGSRGRGLRPTVGAGPHLAGGGSRPDGSRRPAGFDGSGRAGLAGRSTGRHLGHSRRPYGRTARGQPRCCGPAPRRCGYRTAGRGE